MPPDCGPRVQTHVSGCAQLARRAWATSLALACLLLSSGCTSLPEYVHNRFKVGPDYQQPAAPVAGAWIDVNDARVKSDPPADCAWWTVLNDPVLNGLIGSAYRQNLDLRAAGARIIEARAQRAIAVGNLFPQQQSANLTILESQISQNLPIPFPQNFDLVAAGLNGSWELDVWGRYRRAVESADARLGSSIEEYGEVLILMLSDVAVNYVELRTFQQRLANARKNVEIQRGSLQLAEARFKQGASSELDVRQARANMWQTESFVPIFEAGIRTSGNALCVLLGMSPTDLAAALEPAPIPTAPVTVALGMPADLLARRPDVRRAEREVAAQSARIGIATSDLYPSLALNGYVGFWSEDFNHLFDGDSFTGSFIPQFSWNVLNYGRIANNITAQDARLQSVALQYQQTVLRAGKEVEDALARFFQAQQQAKYLERSVADAQRAVELVQIQFEAGATDFNRVYSLQAFLTSQQDQLATAQGNIALNLVAIYKALGGGWRCFLQCQGLPAPCPVDVPVEQAPPAELLPTPPATMPPASTAPAKTTLPAGPAAPHVARQPVVAPTAMPATPPAPSPRLAAPAAAPAPLNGANVARATMPPPSTAPAARGPVVKPAQHTTVPNGPPARMDAAPINAAPKNAAPMKAAPVRAIAPQPQPQPQLQPPPQPKLIAAPPQPAPAVAEPAPQAPALPAAEPKQSGSPEELPPETPGVLPPLPQMPPPLPQRFNTSGVMPASYLAPAQQPR